MLSLTLSGLSLPTLQLPLKGLSTTFGSAPASQKLFGLNSTNIGAAGVAAPPPPPLKYLAAKPCDDGEPNQLGWIQAGGFKPPLMEIRAPGISDCGPEGGCGLQVNTDALGTVGLGSDQRVGLDLYMAFWYDAPTGHLVNAATGKCLDVPFVGTGSFWEEKVVVRECSNAPSQNFYWHKDEKTGDKQQLLSVGSPLAEGTRCLEVVTSAP